MILEDINNELKNVAICSNIHSKLKKHCKCKSLKIGGVVEELIEFYLINPKETQQIIDNYKDNSK